jgi:ribosomal protein L44E
MPAVEKDNKTSFMPCELNRCGRRNNSWAADAKETATGSFWGQAGCRKPGTSVVSNKSISSTVALAKRNWTELAVRPGRLAQRQTHRNRTVNRVVARLECGQCPERISDGLRLDRTSRIGHLSTNPKQQGLDDSGPGRVSTECRNNMSLSKRANAQAKLLSPCGENRGKSGRAASQMDWIAATMSWASVVGCKLVKTI